MWIFSKGNIQKYMISESMSEVCCKLYHIFILGTFGACLSIVSDGQELTNLHAIEKKCSTTIYLLTGNNNGIYQVLTEVN